MVNKTKPKSVSIHPFILIIVGAVISVASFILDQSVESNFALFIIAGIIMSLYGVGKFVFNRDDYHPTNPLTVGSESNKHHRKHQLHTHTKSSPHSHVSHQTQHRPKHNKINPQHYKGPVPHHHQTEYQTSNKPLNFCPNCGARVGHANFCPSCGNKLRQ